MIDLWSAVRWWDEWQLRILVLGSLAIQWFLLIAAPTRQFTIRRWFRTFIWLAYISSDALAIYALATLFNRHARTSISNCTTEGNGSKANALEILWDPVLLIHLGGQLEMTAYNIEDNELWTRHTVTLVSQVTVALYAFYKSWPSSGDKRLLVSAILLFIIGILSFSEKPWALSRASIYRLAAMSSSLVKAERTDRNTSNTGKNKWWKFCFTNLREKYINDKSASRIFYMILSDMSLLAVDHKLKNLGATAERELKNWLRLGFRLIYTRFNVATTPAYLAYHLLLVPFLHIAAITLFALSHKRGRYNATDVKTTYIILCFTAALDVLAGFIRELVYGVMFLAGVPVLCGTIPQYNNVIRSVLRRTDPRTGWLVKLAGRMGYKAGYFAGIHRDLYSVVVGFVRIELVNVKVLKPASYRSFTKRNWALKENLQKRLHDELGDNNEIKRSLHEPFDKSVLIWHMATDLCLCFRLEQADVEGGKGKKKEKRWWNTGGPRLGQGKKRTTDGAPLKEDHRLVCIEAISNYMAHLLNFHPDMLMTGSRQNLFTEAMREVEEILKKQNEPHGLSPKDLAKKIMDVVIGEPMGEIEIEKVTTAIGKNIEEPLGPTQPHTTQACKLAKELRKLDIDTRLEVMYRVWLGMLCYSASMCRGYLHAKSLGEGGEFLSFIWLLLSLQGTKTLADQLQMPEETDEDDDDDKSPRDESSAEVQQDLQHLS